MNSSVAIKGIFLVAVAVGLTVALHSVSNLVFERMMRQSEVDGEIATMFAAPQTVIGPVIVARLRETWHEKYRSHNDKWIEEKRYEEHVHAFFPDTLKYSTTMTVEERALGIFKTPVYFTDGRMEGTISVPSLNKFKRREGSSIQVTESKIMLTVSDIRGFTSAPKITWKETEIALDGISGHSSLNSAIPLSMDGTNGAVDFSIDIKLHGVISLFVAPVAGENNVDILGSWPHPGFKGEFLPITRNITEKGFKAHWHVSGIATNTQANVRSLIEKSSDFIGASQTFGVELIRPQNPYSLTDRAVKYGFLFIALTFASFFLFETQSGLRIHPIQYGFVGLAQSVFFLLLLSLSEHTGFGVSYLVATAGVVISITYYLVRALKGWKRGGAFGFGLAMVYGMLFVIMQSEDHALLIGSALLFIVLSLAMAKTRDVDWYNLPDRGEEEKAVA
ncbi:MAG: cell envelope integrity protein CreD [Nitrospinota bacterium]|nr:cell envelope integrity protein CreD [Nitrospinota bacterium]